MAFAGDQSDIAAQAARAEAVVRYLVETKDAHHMLQLQAGPSVIDGLDGEQVYQAVLTAKQLYWIEGTLSEQFGGSWLWTQLNPTFLGLRQVEAWPSEGREYVPGPWDDSHWGQDAKPVLERLRDDPEWGQRGVALTMGPSGDDERHWLALNLLDSAGYIDARVDNSHVAGAIITLQGQQALAPPATGISAVSIQLARGDVTRALIDLVEGVISDYCTELAEQCQVEMTDKNGKPLHKLWQRVERLEKEGALSGVEASIFRTAMAARNDISHVVTDDIQDGRDLVRWLIDGVEMVVSARSRQGS